MRLTLQTDFALRILMTLAKTPGEVRSVEEIATYFDLSHHHLMKTAQALARSGFIKTTRGRSGGIMLKQDANAITVGAVVRAIEPDLRMAECFQANQKGTKCALLPSCKLKPVLGEALFEFLAVLDNKKLSEII
ncbi:MAG: Rrf2 family transcriptional regulator [Salaquimonas sp.]